jgi:peptidoglycan hydrolase-like protein with peptidoglycan-binding domain
VPSPPRDFAPATVGVLDGTPYQNSPPQAQQRVVMSAQAALARRGYYRGLLDGIYGPEMAFALRAFQSRFRIAPSGRLDVDTLAALGLLPGQPAPGLTTPRYRHYPPRPQMVAPDGEPIYVPR